MLSGGFGVFKHLPGVILKRLRGYKQSVCNFRISCALHKVKQYLKIKLIEGYKHIFKLYKLCQIRVLIIFGKGVHKFKLRLPQGFYRRQFSRAAEYAGCFRGEIFLWEADNLCLSGDFCYAAKACKLRQPPERHRRGCM